MIIISHAQNATRAVTLRVYLWGTTHSNCLVCQARIADAGMPSPTAEVQHTWGQNSFPPNQGYPLLFTLRVLDEQSLSLGMPGKNNNNNNKNCDIHLRYAQYRSRCRRVVVAAWQRVDSLQIKKHTGPSSSAAVSKLLDREDTHTHTHWSTARQKHVELYD